jgi:hypothetical protein
MAGRNGLVQPTAGVRQARPPDMLRLDIQAARRLDTRTARHPTIATLAADRFRRAVFNAIRDTNGWAARS